MHEGLRFPIDCSFPQRVYRRYSWRGNTLRAASDNYNTFDAFARQDIIPSLINLVQNTTQTERAQKTAVKRWVDQYGWLTAPIPPYGIAYFETFEDFWGGAREFVRLWEVYGFILNRKLKELKKLVRFVEVDPTEPLGHAPAGTHARTVFTHNESNGGWYSAAYDTFYKATVAEIKKDALPYYQQAVFEYVARTVERKLRGINLASKGRAVVRDIIQDHYKIIPCLRPPNMLQALYLQFYILLNDRSKKICETCGAIFAPSRRDAKYCSDTCKNTAKARRYRARKRARAKKVKTQRKGG